MEDYACEEQGIDGHVRLATNAADERDACIAYEGPASGDCDAENPERNESRLWETDTGTLPFEARSTLLKLVRGPYISETEDAKLWNALLNHRGVIESRLADLFLELCLDRESGIAFARNASADEAELPKATRSTPMTFLDTIMVLTLRKELLIAGGRRVFIGQDELFEQMKRYRDISNADQAAYQGKLKASWNRLVGNNILLRSSDESRFEVSPVLRIVFGAEEAAAVEQQFERMMEERSEEATLSAEIAEEDGPSEEPFEDECLSEEVADEQ